MNNLQEIPCSVTREIDGKQYIVRKFGYNGQVYEEHLIPVPTEKTIRTFKKDGTEDTTKQKKEPIKLQK